MLNIIAFVILGLIIVVLPLSVSLGRSIRKDRCDKKLDNIYNGEGTKITLLNDSSDNQYRLRDYYIKSSYNSCCCGDFSDSFVSYNALKVLISQGVRFFDFEIYSVKGKSVIAASKDDNFNIKGTLNHLPIINVFKLLNQKACNENVTGTICPNPTDPLFINLRIKSNQNDIFQQIGSALDIFSDKLLHKKHRKYASSCQGYSLGNEGLLCLKNSVIIICDKPSRELPPELKEAVNMNSNSSFLQSLRYSNAVHSDLNELKTYNKKNMSIIMPDYNTLALNDGGWDILHNNGCQFICMNFQTDNGNLKNYLNIFEDKLSAFVLKPECLRYKPTYIKIPDENIIAPPETSYGPRSFEVPGDSNLLF